MNRELLTYEESVHWIRSQPKYVDLVQFCYLDRDNLAAAMRFANSEEFHEVSRLLKLGTTKRSLKILDLGCGNGIASYAFASLGHEVFAVDPDTSNDVGLEAAARLDSVEMPGSIKTFQAFAESLPFSNSSFDIIYARQALHHFSDLNKGLSECLRVLKPKGLLLATREHVVNNEKQLKEFLENHILHKWHGGENAYPLPKYLSAIKSSGLHISKYFGPYDSVINHYPISNIEIRRQFLQRLKKKIGLIPASFFVKIVFLEKAYRFYLSRSCKAPGRLYSFLCTKSTFADADSL